MRRRRQPPLDPVEQVEPHEDHALVVTYKFVDGSTEEHLIYVGARARCEQIDRHWATSTITLVYYGESELEPVVAVTMICPESELTDDVVDIRDRLPRESD